MLTKQTIFWLKIFFEYFKMLVTVIGLITGCSNRMEYAWVAKLLRYEILHQSFQLKNDSIEKKTQQKTEF